jgi:hypothetical protein
MDRHKIFPIHSIDQALEADKWAKSRAREILDEMVEK